MELENLLNKSELTAKKAAEVYVNPCQARLEELDRLYRPRIQVNDLIDPLNENDRAAQKVAEAIVNPCQALADEMDRLFNRNIPGIGFHDIPEILFIQPRPQINIERLVIHIGAMKNEKENT